MAKALLQGSIKIKSNSLNLSLTLTTGQNFRWRKCKNNPNEWIGIVDNLYVLSLQQHLERIDYKVLNYNFIQQHFNGKQQSNGEIVKNIDKVLIQSLERYFRLDSDLNQLYSQWFTKDLHFLNVCSKYPGIRLLRQEVIENIFSFICSSNNNVSRISNMVEALCNNYGTLLFKCNDQQYEDIYSFPDILSLSHDNVEANLRKLNFGYRAKYISQTAKKIINESENNGDDWIHRLKMYSYEDAKATLMSLPGIGAKVADCICLMSLGHTEAIPIDTHIFQITAKYYLPQLKVSKSLSTSKYNEIANFYRDKFQIHPGWGQTVLFCLHLLKLEK